LSPPSGHGAAPNPETCIPGAEGAAADGIAHPKTHASTPSHNESPVAAKDRKPSEPMELQLISFALKKSSLVPAPRGDPKKEGGGGQTVN
jgi:hypothetical protein